ncbi:MAG: hypothetical protein H0V91_16160 [Flavisolibacter sp.]|jgi:hypothetical protein|nr:hypothetical protein [Flavisolibacter sp.]
MPEKNNHTNKNAVDALFWREEILQVLYWMEGEGLETAVPFSRLMVLLNTTPENLLFHLKKNIEAGYLQTGDDGISENSSVKMTSFGKKEAGGIFRNAFEGMQKGGHGECGPDCEFCYVEGEKLEDCVHNCADSRHHH